MKLRYIFLSLSIIACLLTVLFEEKGKIEEGQKDVSAIELSQNRESQIEGRIQRDLSDEVFDEVEEAVKGLRQAA